MNKNNHKPFRKTVFWVCIILLSAVMINSSVRAETEPKETFPETGYSIEGEFYRYFYSAKDPLVTFGYPITNACIDPKTGFKTQYFQKARFELIEDFSGSYIKQTKLGLFFYHKETGTDMLKAEKSAGCRYFAETDKSVCYAFLSFYDTYQGDTFLGLPVSNMMRIENERLVQYFEYGRLEWRPDAPEGQHIAMTDLGKIYYDEFGKGTLVCAENNILNGQPLKLQAYAFVTDALVPANSTQKLYIIVLDQNYQPVEGAMMEVLLHIPGKEGPQSYRPPMDTDNHGIAILEFPVDNLPVKAVVQIEVNVRYKSLQTQTNSWFRIWW